MGKRLWGRKDRQQQHDAANKAEGEDDEEMKRGERKRGAAEMGAEEPVAVQQGAEGIQVSHEQRSMNRESAASTAERGEVQDMRGGEESQRGMGVGEDRERGKQRMHDEQERDPQEEDLHDARGNDGHSHGKKKKKNKKNKNKDSSHKKKRHKHPTPPFCEASEFTLNCKAPDLGCTLIECADLPARIQKLLPEGWEGIFVDWMDPTGRLALDTSVRKYDQLVRVNSSWVVGKPINSALRALHHAGKRITLHLWRHTPIGDRQGSRQVLFFQTHANAASSHPTHDAPRLVSTITLTAKPHGMGVTLALSATGEIEVDALEPDLPAALDGRLRVGDTLLALNGKAVGETSFGMAQQTLNSPGTLHITFAREQMSAEPTTSKAEPLMPDSAAPDLGHVQDALMAEAAKYSDIAFVQQELSRTRARLLPGSQHQLSLTAPPHDVAMQHHYEAERNGNNAITGAAVEMVHATVQRQPQEGFGMTVAGLEGEDVPLGTQGVVIADIVPNGACDRCGVIQIGDQIVRIDGTPVEGDAYNSAVSLLKASGQQVQLVLARPQDSAAHNGSQEWQQPPLPTAAAGRSGADDDEAVHELPPPSHEWHQHTSQTSVHLEQLQAGHAPHEQGQSAFASYNAGPNPLLDSLSSHLNQAIRARGSQEREQLLEDWHRDVQSASTRHSNSAAGPDAGSYFAQYTEGEDGPHFQRDVGINGQEQYVLQHAQQDLNVAVTAATPFMDRDVVVLKVPARQGASFGVSVRDTVLRKYPAHLSANPDLHFLCVTDIAGGSVMREAGLEPGDCLLGINNTPLFGMRTEDALSLLKNATEGFVLVVGRVLTEDNSGTAPKQLVSLNVQHIPKGLPAVRVRHEHLPNASKHKCLVAMDVLEGSEDRESADQVLPGDALIYINEHCLVDSSDLTPALQALTEGFTLRFVLIRTLIAREGDPLPVNMVQWSHHREPQDLVGMAHCHLEGSFVSLVSPQQRPRAEALFGTHSAWSSRQGSALLEHKLLPGSRHASTGELKHVTNFQFPPPPQHELAHQAHGFEGHAEAVQHASSPVSDPHPSSGPMLDDSSAGVDLHPPLPPGSLRMVPLAAGDTGYGLRLIGPHTMEDPCGIFIAELIPGMPGRQCRQLVPGDEILFINNVDVSQSMLCEVSGLIRSSPFITLTIKHDDKRFDACMQRLKRNHSEEDLLSSLGADKNTTTATTAATTATNSNTAMGVATRALVSAEGSSRASSGLAGHMGAAAASAMASVEGHYSNTSSSGSPTSALSVGRRDSGARQARRRLPATPSPERSSAQTETAPVDPMLEKGGVAQQGQVEGAHEERGEAGEGAKQSEGNQTGPQFGGQVPTSSSEEGSDAEKADAEAGWMSLSIFRQVEGPSGAGNQQQQQHGDQSADRASAQAEQGVSGWKTRSAKQGHSQRRKQQRKQQQSQRSRSVSQSLSISSSTALDQLPTPNLDVDSKVARLWKSEDSDASRHQHPSRMQPMVNRPALSDDFEAESIVAKAWKNKSPAAAPARRRVSLHAMSAIRVDILFDKRVIGLGLDFVPGKLEGHRHDFVFVENVFPSFTNGKTSRVKRGDVLLMVNNRDVSKMRFAAVWSHLSMSITEAKSKQQTLSLVFVRPPHEAPSTESSSATPPTSGPTPTTAAKAQGTHGEHADNALRIRLCRGKSGYGLALRTTPKTDGKETTIVRGVRPGSQAEESGIRAGDVVLAVNDRATHHLTHDEVVEAIAASPGEVELVLQHGSVA